MHSQNQWWIHLRARIRASHARHRGSNPLSTTKGRNESWGPFLLLYNYSSLSCTSRRLPTLRLAYSPRRLRPQISTRQLYTLMYQEHRPFCIAGSCGIYFYFDIFPLVPFWRKRELKCRHRRQSGANYCGTNKYILLSELPHPEKRGAKIWFIK